MAKNPGNGRKKDPLALERKSVIEAAAGQFCSACGGRPCYLVTSTALAVFYQVFSHEEDCTSTDRYEQSLARVHECLMKHYELIEMRRADKHHPSKPEVAISNQRNNGVYVKGLYSHNLPNEARDP